MTPFQLRPWQISDLDSLVVHANNPHIARNLTNAFPHPYTREAGENFIQYASAPGKMVFAIIVDGQAVGGIGVHPQSDIFSKNAEMGYWLSETYWGQGIVSAAIEEIVNHAFANSKLERIFARPFGSNQASCRVLEKNGFVLEARLHQTIYKNEKYEDELIYAIRRRLLP